MPAAPGLLMLQVTQLHSAKWALLQVPNPRFQTL